MLQSSVVRSGDFGFFMADGAVFGRIHRLLGGKHAIHRVAALRVAAVTQLLAKVRSYLRKQRVVEAQCQVLDLDLRGVAASAGAAGGDAADLVAPAMVHEA